MHGLWPDFCNGSYTQYCDLRFVFPSLCSVSLPFTSPNPQSQTKLQIQRKGIEIDVNNINSRQYDPAPSPNTTNGLSSGTPVPAYTGGDISSWLTSFGAYDLLAYMNKFWIAQGTPNWVIWAHEFSKHATCFSSFSTPCYGPLYQNHSDVVDFFETAVQYYEILPTYGWLSAAGIRPSNTTAVSLVDLQEALVEGFGALPYIGCTGPKWNATEAGKGSADNGYTVLDEVWYYYHVYGRVQRGQGVPVNASINGGSVSSCATTKGALRYPVRSVGSEAVEV